MGAERKSLGKAGEGVRTSERRVVTYVDVRVGGRGIVRVEDLPARNGLQKQAELSLVHFAAVHCLLAEIR